MVEKNPTAYDVSQRGILLPGAFSLGEEQLLDYGNKIRSILGYEALTEFHG